jgi:anti-sigma factor RsiW
MKRAIRAAASRYTPPQELRLRIEKSVQSEQKPIWTTAFLPWVTAFAATLLLFVLPVVLWTRHSSRERAVAQLLDLHIATLASSNPVDVVSTDRHTVKPWFQGKLPFAFNLPELENSRFKLIGGRLVYFEHRPAVQLLFEMGKHELSVFIVQESGGTATPASLSENGFSTESWIHDHLRYVVVSDASPADVHALGELFRTASR